MSAEDRTTRAILVLYGVAAAVVLWLCVASVTVTFSPASAFPHTRLRMPCWSTMWSPNMLLSETSAEATGESTAATSSRAAVSRSVCHGG